MAEDSATITPRENGPLIVAHVKTLRNARGEPLESNPRFALCRCGQSSNKPFCDGTHAKVGFSGKPAAGGAGKVDNYAGKELTIHDNRALCAHAGYCSDRLAPVFRYGQEPWIDPDGATAAQITQAVKACPSGALSYSVGEKTLSDQQREPEIRVSKNGPYHVTGGVELAEGSFAAGASREHYALCRCGASKNKPFCDGSHHAAKFRDPGA